MNVVQTSPASNTALVNNDYDQAGAVNNPDEGSTRLDLGSWSTSGYNNFLLNATGTTWISTTGVTKLGLREGHDALDTAPSAPSPPDNNIAQGYFVDQTGSSNDPKLVVEHSGSLVGGPAGDYGPLVENGDFRKYEYVDEEWWRVTDKYGTVYTFGEATTTRQNKDGEATTTYKWMLEEVRDRNDNYISYQYYKNVGQIYPYKITYTGHGSSDGPFEIEFARTYDPDIATTTDTGFPVKTYYKLSEIHLKANGSLVRNYALSYTNGYQNINRLLSSVTEAGRDELGATTTLPAQTFNYNDGFDLAWSLDSQFSTSSIDHFVRTAACSGGALLDNGTRPIDANGDGYADLILGEGTSKWVRLNNTTKGWLDPGYFIPTSFVLSSADTGLRILDANGDGLPDLFQHESSATSSHLNIGAGWWDPDPGYQFGGAILSNVKFGDVNGDGLTDYIDNHGSVRKTYLNQGDGTGWEENTGYVVPAAFYAEGSAVIDVNKDGLDDLFISVSTSTEERKSLHQQGRRHWLGVRRSLLDSRVSCRQHWRSG